MAEHKVWGNFSRKVLSRYGYRTSGMIGLGIIFTDFEAPYWIFWFGIENPKILNCMDVESNYLVENKIKESEDIFILDDNERYKRLEEARELVNKTELMEILIKEDCGIIIKVDARDGKILESNLVK